VGTIAGPQSVVLLFGGSIGALLLWTVLRSRLIMGQLSGYWDHV
jgi:hypothetical protein